MADTQKSDRKPDEAKADAEEAIKGGATKVTLQRKDNGNWDLTITMP